MTLTEAKALEEFIQKAPDADLASTRCVGALDAILHSLAYGHPADPHLLAAIALRIHRASLVRA
jgi:hypothetical protein